MEPQIQAELGPFTVYSDQAGAFPCPVALGALFGLHKLTGPNDEDH